MVFFWRRPERPFISVRLPFGVFSIHEKRIFIFFWFTNFCVCTGIWLLAFVDIVRTTRFTLDQGNRYETQPSNVFKINFYQCLFYEFNKKCFVFVFAINKFKVLFNFTGSASRVWSSNSFLSASVGFMLVSVCARSFGIRSVIKPQCIYG